MTTSYAAPPAALAGRSLRAKWDEGQTFADFLPTAQTYPELWARPREVAPEAVARAAALPGRWHLLVLSEDWCVDALDPVPALARLAELAPNLDLRLLARDEHLDLMDEHLTDGRSRSIPAVLLLDADFVERGWWGPRPAEVQAWYASEGRLLEPDERYKRLRTWYARDKGRTAVGEVLTLLEQVAAPVRAA